MTPDELQRAVYSEIYPGVRDAREAERITEAVSAAVKCFPGSFIESHNGPTIPEQESTYEPPKQEELFFEDLDYLWERFESRLKDDDA